MERRRRTARGVAKPPPRSRLPRPRLPFPISRRSGTFPGPMAGPTPVPG